MPGSYGHLFKRFFDFTLAKPLDANEAAAVESWVTPEEAAIFFEQDPRDQAHGYAAAMAVVGDGHDIDVVVAALLHDVGKRHARLGVVGRSLASILIKLGLPLTKRMKLYRDHGALAATELLSIGSSRIVIQFARHHHGPRPAGFDEPAWGALQNADNPAKTFIPTARR
jgi:hypothetical protein